MSPTVEHSKPVRLARAALAAVQEGEDGRAGRLLDRISNECGWAGVHVAIQAWCDSYLDHALDGKVDDQRRRTGEPVWIRADTGQLDREDSDLPADVLWAGKTINARCDMDADAFRQLMAELPDGVDGGRYVWRLLGMVASSISGLPRGFGLGSSAERGWLDPPTPTPEPAPEPGRPAVPAELTAAIKAALRAVLVGDGDEAADQFDIIAGHHLPGLFTACSAWATVVASTMPPGDSSGEDGWFSLEFGAVRAGQFTAVNPADIPADEKGVVWAGQFLTAWLNKDTGTAMAVFNAATADALGQGAVWLLRQAAAAIDEAAGPDPAADRACDG